MKSFIIRLKNNSFSNKLAEETQVSCKKFNLDAVFFDGIQLVDIKNLEKYNLKINTNQKPITLGTIGCFLSHWTLWRQCSEDSSSYLILEHDAIVLKDPRKIENEVKEVCHLDAFIPFNSSLPSDSEEHFLKYNTNVNLEKNGITEYPKNSFYPEDKLTEELGTFSFRGAYGYLLKPAAAKKLIDFCNEVGVLPADRAICDKILFLQRSNSTYVRLNPFFKSLKLQRDFSTRI